MKPPAFQLYADDFIAGTCDLSALDVGAYIRLLCYQWNRGSIPTDDLDRLARIAGAPVSADVLAKFPRGKNARMEQVRRKQEDYRAIQSLKGKASAKARFNRGSTVVQPPLVQPEGNSPSPSPSPSNTIDHSVIEAVWSAYPRKVGKKKACAIIASLLRKGRTDLPDKVKAYADAVATWPAGDEQYIPHPSTWFGRGSYDDPPETWQRKVTSQQSTKPDRINFKTDDYSGIST